MINKISSGEISTSTCKSNPFSERFFQSFFIFSNIFFSFVRKTKNDEKERGGRCALPFQGLDKENSQELFYHYGKRKFPFLTSSFVQKPYFDFHRFCFFLL